MEVTRILQLAKKKTKQKNPIMFIKAKDLELCPEKNGESTGISS